MALRIFCCLVCVLAGNSGRAQTGIQTPERYDPVPEEDTDRIEEGLQKLQDAVSVLARGDRDRRLLADVAVLAKGVEWCLRHAEFYKPRKGKGKTVYVRYCEDAIATGLERARLQGKDQIPWMSQPGSTIRGYFSRVDGSLQPYALSLPENFADVERLHRWPLHVKLHG
ncbi:MAG: hypothetical protein VB858_17290, partial [Planctomycetaceae bacterium]